MPSILISGASIAGPALAWQLARLGFETVIVERAPGPRPGGQAIDVRGAALEVLRRMDLLEPASSLRTRLKGVVTLDREGNEVARSDEMTLSGGRFATEDFEILRDDLVSILMEAVPQDTEVIFDDSVTGLEDDGHGSFVTFERSRARRFDLVVGADGMHSNIRRLVFGDERQFLVPVGVALAVYSAPNRIGLDGWQIVCRGEGGALCIASPVRDNSELRLCFSFPASLDEEHHDDIEAQKSLLADRCGKLGWQVPELLQVMHSTPDFYLGAIAQVKLPVWREGRVVLLGDAAHCPSPATGQGTSLALVGAHVLGQELARSPSDLASASIRYEKRMRPFVETNHALLAAMREAGGEDAMFRRLDAAKHAIDLDGA